jgi:hypothetical protein
LLSVVIILSLKTDHLVSPINKSGDGAHNWGNPLHDYQNEPDLADQDDLKADTEGEGLPPVDSAAEPASAGDADAKGVDIKGPERKMSMTDEEREKAREFRHGALKNDHGESTTPFQSVGMA